MTTLMHQPRPEPPRDRFGRYLIGGKSWTRVTTLCSAIDDRFNLEQWMQRMVAIGLAQRPDLLALVLAAGEDKAKLTKLCDQAQEAAKAKAGANMGTALHALCEQVDLGQILALPPDIQRDIDAYVEATKGLTMDVEHIERIVLCRALGCAGTFDRMAIDGGTRYIADLKTGQTLDHSHLSIAQQLAIYANAEEIFDQVTGELAPMPEVDKKRALVIHLPAGSGQCTLHWVDIKAGWEAAQVSYAVRTDWRKRKLIHKYDSPPVPGTPDPGQPEVQATVDGPAVREAQPPVTVAAMPFYNEQIQSRALSISGDYRPVAAMPLNITSPWGSVVDDMAPGATQTGWLSNVADVFAGLPGNEPAWLDEPTKDEPCAPSASNASTPANGVSGSGVEVHPAEPSASTLPLISETSPESSQMARATGTTATPPTEGRSLPLENRDAIQRRYNGLVPARQSLIQRWLLEAAKDLPAGFGLRDQVTERRFDTMAGIVNAVDMGLTEDTIRTLVGVAMGLGDEVPGSTSTGVALGSMHHTEAAVFARLVDAIGHDEVPLTKAGRLGAKAMPALAAIALGTVVG